MRLKQAWRWLRRARPSVFYLARAEARGGDRSSREIERAFSIEGGLDLLEARTPQSYAAAKASEDWPKWKAAMEKEIASCRENDTWQVVPRSELPARANILPCKWVFKIKTDQNGVVTQYKARITPKGFRQKHGVDYFEVFAHTGKYKTLRLLLSLAATYDLELSQMDVPSAFVKAELEEDVYMEMPEGIEQAGMVCWLLKSLYGLKQAPRNWYLLFSSFIKEGLGFTACVSDPCLFFKRTRSGRLMLIFLFVDDMKGAFAKVDEEEWNEVKAKLKQRFDVKDLGESEWMLGMCITRVRSRRTIRLDQQLYTQKLLEKHGLLECKTARTPAAQNNGEQEDDRDGGGKPCELLRYQELVGSLLYASISTRPDIAYAVQRLTRFMQAPLMRHWKAALRVLRYLAGTRDAALTFGRQATERRRSDAVGVSAYSDADWASDKVDRKSVTGWIALVNGDPVSWASKKQRTVAQSSCEAELYAMSAATNEILWLRSLLGELGLQADGPSRLHVDNQGAIEVGKHGVKSERTKHVDIKYHHLTDTVEKGQVVFEWVRTQEQLADIMTKALAAPAFQELRARLMQLTHFESHPHP